jgi:glycosyltransferase involved in cell wall biosynthesis
MTRILFFIEDNWAFGSIHRALCKELYLHGIYANLLDWQINYPKQDFEAYLNIYDYFVTLPGLSVSVLNNYGVPNSRIIAIAHAEYDIYGAIGHRTDINSLHKFAVIHECLSEVAVKNGITRKPEIITNGIHYDYYYQEPSKQLNIIGYAANIEGYSFDQTIEIKRGKLVIEVAKQLQLEFKPTIGLRFLAMPDYYRTVDCVVMSSSQDACGLPMMEAACAGRLPIGTPLGILKNNPNAGIIVPIEPQQFIEETKSVISYYHHNPSKYIEKCREIQEYAKNHYDWKHVIDQWVNLFRS